MASAGVIRDVIASPAPRTPARWTLSIWVGSAHRTLKMRDENRAREFLTSDAALRYASNLGVTSVAFNLRDWDKDPSHDRRK